VKRNHSNCCRSTPRERRNRTTSDTMEASIPTITLPNSTDPRSDVSGCGAPAIPTRLAMVTPSRSWPDSVGWTMPSAASVATQPVTSQKTGRQRRVGSRPSGNSTGR
jgi:hypothetical protein